MGKAANAEWAGYGLRLGVLDLGTNSIRFDAYALDERGQAERIHREKRMLRLGEGLYETGHIGKPALARLDRALHDFSRMLREWGIDRVRAFATSALRDTRLPQRHAILAGIKRRHGITFTVISGAREAGLIARGVLANESLPRGDFLLCDIGGGSTEISLCRGRRVKKSFSLGLGTLRLKQLFLTQLPSSSLSLLALRGYIHSQLPKGGLPRAAELIGSSGTVRALSRMASRSRRPFNRAFLSQLNLNMAGMGRAQLLKLPGMEEKRADILLGGSLLLEELAALSGAKRIRASGFSLRDGVLDEELARLGGSGIQ